MKRKLMTLLLALAAMTTLGAGCSDSETGSEEDYSTGYSDGYSDGTNATLEIIE